MANINSFSENMRQVIVGQNNILSNLSALQQAMVTNQNYANYEYVDLDGSTYLYQIPSYTSLTNRLDSIETTLRSLSAGTGLVSISDNQNYQRIVKLSSVATPPNRITGVTNPSTFDIDPNWFFENIMFPGAVVSIDLTGLIENSADRVKVKRVILSSDDSSASSVWSNNIYTNSYTYQELITLLEDKNISYSEDEEDINLPLTYNTFKGEFTVIDDPMMENNNIWYVLNTINYYGVDENGLTTSQNVLSKNDYISYNDSIFNIVEINQNENKVRLKPISGAALPGVNSTLNYYQNPFRNKTVNIRFGSNEYNIIYIKGVAEEYNLLSNEWSTPILFDSNSLLYVGDGVTKFSDYYVKNIVDWGSTMIAEAKEKRITAYYGKTPNTPILSDTDFKVVQINTQINAALDTNEIINNAAEIETTKSEIQSLKSTIAAQKTQLANTSKSDEYTALQKKINTNITDLQNKQASYSTLVKNLQNTVKENSAVLTNPKYHIRGFFPIPELQYTDEGKTVKQEIIGFDIKYHYIKEDSTATALEKYNYTDSDGNSVTGVFTDWVEILSPQKHRVFNTSTDTYQWNTENTANGEEININQIDIPITKGEKVEFMVRSISEAGYPGNCLKSEWSNAITITFPSSLDTENSIANLITEINDDALDITINNTLDSLGLTSHISDSIPNVNSVNGLYYNHIASDIAYEFSNDGSIKTISVQDAIDKIIDGSTKTSNSSIIEIASRVTELETCCLDVSNMLTSILDRLDNLEKAVNPFQIINFISTPNEFEYGTSQDITLTWNYNNLDSISIKELSITGGNKLNGNITDLTSTTAEDTITNDTTYKLTLVSSKDITYIKNLTVNTYKKLFYWTSSNSNEDVISTSANNTKSSGSGTLTFNNSNSNYYIYVAVPSSQNIEFTYYGLPLEGFNKNNAVYNNINYTIYISSSLYDKDKTLKINYSIL